MPYRRKAYKKRTYGHNGPTYVKCAKMVISDGAKALQLAKYLKTIVNVEFKNHDSTGTAVARSATPAIINLTSIAQGDTNLTRDGSNCKLVSLQFKYFIEQHASAVNTQIRVMIVLDKQTNQALYTAGDLLEDITVDDIIVSMPNIDNAARFNIMYDRVHTYSDSGRTNSYHKMYKKVQIKLRFDAPEAAIAAMVVNSVSLFIVSNEATNTPTMTHHLRWRFVDN